MWHLLFQRGFAIKRVKNQPRLSWILRLHVHVEKTNFTYRSVDKNLMTGSNGNSEFCFPEILNIPWGEAQQKKEKTANSFAWRQLKTYKFAAVSKSPTWSRASRKLKLLFPLGVSDFDPRHVTRFTPIKKRVWVSRYNKVQWTTIPPVNNHLGDL